MKNKILVLTCSSVPYIKELRLLAGSVTGCILMQQLDYWFWRSPDGFYKFQQPTPNHSSYRTGDSWCEELNLTHDEYRTAFDKIGIRYTSRTAYQTALREGDPFKGRFYLSYHDKRSGLTYYLRNHDVTDAAINGIFHVDDSVVGKPQLQAQKNISEERASGDNQFCSRQIPVIESADTDSVTGDSQPEYTETTGREHNRDYTETTPTPDAGTPNSAPEPEPVSVVDGVSSPPAEGELTVTLFDWLVSPEQGVNRSDAAEIVSDPVLRETAEREREQYWPLRREKVRSNPGALLTQAIRRGYGPPAGYVEMRAAEAKRLEKVRRAAARTANKPAETAPICPMPEPCVLIKEWPLAVTLLLEGELPTQIRAHLGSIAPVEHYPGSNCQPDTVVVSCLPALRDWLDKRLCDPLEKALATVLDHQVSVKFQGVSLPRHGDLADAR